MKNRFVIIALVFVVSLAFSVSASGNDTVDSIMNLAGNIPTSTIFFEVAGNPGGVGSIELVPNSTTTLSCWGVADDLDGISALDDLTSVIYADSATRDGQNNASIVYRNDSCDITAWSSGSGEWNCTYQVQYYAEPSDWTCAVNITNVPVTILGGSVVFYNDTINTTSTIEELVALSVHNRTVDFGLRAVGENYTADTPVLVYNEGNVDLDLQLDAFNSSSTFDDDSTQAMNCTIGYVPTEYMRFSLVSEESYLASVPMSSVGATANQALGLAPRVFGQGTNLPTSATTYWAPGIPMNIAGSCTGRLMYIGQIAD